MKIAVMRGFLCGHFSERKELILEKGEKLNIDFDGEGYCNRCNNFLKLKRLNIFVIERDVPEIV